MKQSLALIALLASAAVSFAQERTYEQRMADVERAMPAVMSILSKHTSDIQDLQADRDEMKAQIKALLKANGMVPKTTQAWDGAATTWSQSSEWQSSDTSSDASSPRTPVRTIFRRVFQRSGCAGGG